MNAWEVLYSFKDKGKDSDKLINEQVNFGSPNTFRDVPKNCITLMFILLIEF
jgi:hypothetical protein